MITTNKITNLSKVLWIGWGNIIKQIILMKNSWIERIFIHPLFLQSLILSKQKWLNFSNVDTARADMWKTYPSSSTQEVNKQILMSKSLCNEVTVWSIWEIIIDSTIKSYGDFPYICTISLYYVNILVVKPITCKI